MRESWKPIAGYVGRYEVSNRGRVRSLPGRQRGRILRPGAQSRGYLTVLLYDGSKPKKPRSHLVHLLVMAAFGPACPGVGYTVNHKDLDKGNNAATNLEWLTDAANKAHAVEHGGSHCGESSAQAKISDVDMRELLQRLAAAPTDRTLCRRLGEEYGLSPDYVRQLRNGRGRPRERPAAVVDR